GDFGPLRFEILGIERNHLFVKSDARDLHGNPWAQRPRGIVLVADDEFERHPSSRDVLRLSAQSLGQRVDVKVIFRAIARLRRRRWWAQRTGAVKPRLDPRGPLRSIGTALAAARYHVMPSITAVRAAATTAIVAVSPVTARADHRSSRSRRACATAARGKAGGIADRISTRIIG